METVPTNHSDTLKHVLCNALVHLQAISAELKKLDLKEEEKDNAPEKWQHANRLYLTMVAINDIIHPGHPNLYEYFKGTEEYFDMLVKMWDGSKKENMNFNGCLCFKCGSK